MTGVEAAVSGVGSVGGDVSGGEAKRFLGRDGTVHCLRVLSLAVGLELPGAWKLLVLDLAPREFGSWGTESYQ